MCSRRQNRRLFAPVRTKIIGVVIIILVVLSVDFVEAQGLTDNNVLNLSGSVLINIYEEYGRKGFSEYELSLPEGVMRGTNKGKNGVFIKEPDKLAMMSSDTFSGLYTAKKQNKIISKKIAFSGLDIDKELIFDTAWSPNGLYIAVLSVTWRYSYNPIYLLFTISGHPIIYRTYYLRIYSLDGKLAYKSGETDIGTFNAGRGSGWGSVVWTNKDNSSINPARKDEQNK